MAMNRVDTNVVELAPRRARQNMRALLQAKRRHPSSIGNVAMARPTPVPAPVAEHICQVLPFKR